MEIEHASAPQPPIHERPILMMPTPRITQPIQRPFRVKQRIFRSPTPLQGVSSPAETPPRQPSQHNVGSTSDGLSSETIAAVAETTLSRIIKQLTKPTFNPPRKN
ncbi:hypothetical protein PIB30_023970 [Stylosanthes scabra]|uniref:Uncharacterized protein n=1 Tax=Stylosanthes scabra TaxID=79078 RepID=A0ABU6X756_9FABA|nr:hypothetical protein [Stylosanthes scabra]